MSVRHLDTAMPIYPKYFPSPWTCPSRITIHSAGLKPLPKCSLRILQLQGSARCYIFLMILPFVKPSKNIIIQHQPNTGSFCQAAQTGSPFSFFSNMFFIPRSRYPAGGRLSDRLPELPWSWPSPNTSQECFHFCYLLFSGSASVKTPLPSEFYDSSTTSLCVAAES